MGQQESNNIIYGDCVDDEDYVDLTEKIIHLFINSLIENSITSHAHFSKTIDKHFWDLV